MKILLHICCGPCSLYPHSSLVAQNHEVTGFFYNSNIHPYQEFQKRLQTAKQASNLINLPLITEENYELTNFLRTVVFRESNRCQFCYYLRLKKTAQIGVQSGFDAFTTTLLYSVYQNHQEIIKVAEAVSEKENIKFYYEDFRVSWKEGFLRSKELGLYRQSYCGCIYSERERYDQSLQISNISKNVNFNL